jgi:hypothetical protein
MHIWQRQEKKKKMSQKLEKSWQMEPLKQTSYEILLPGRTLVVES